MVSTQIIIAAGPDAVFEYLTNLKYHYLWNPQTRKLSTYKPIKLGSEYQSESQVLGMTVVAVNKVTKYVPPKELVIENNVGIVGYQAHFRLTPKAKRTLVQLSTTLSTDSSIGIFTIPVLKQLALRELRTDLQALKVAVENHLK